MKPLVLAALIVMLAACSKNHSTGHSQINGTWTMIRVSDEHTAQIFTRPSNLRDVIIELQGDDHGGSFSGSTSVNTILPSQYILADKHVITIPAVSRTKAYEPIWGSLLLDNLTQAHHYDVSRPGLLRIFTTDYILEFRKR